MCEEFCSALTVGVVLGCRYPEKRASVALKRKDTQNTILPEQLLWKQLEFVALVELLFPTLKNSLGIGVWFTVQQVVATPRSGNPTSTLDI